MSDNEVPLRKTAGGTTLTFEGAEYEWPHDGAVTVVPGRLAARLLAIQDGGYTVAGPEDGEPEDGDGAEVTEPAPTAGTAVTEPAPKPTGRRPVTGTATVRGAGK